MRCRLEELEQKCKRYRRKWLIPLSLLFLLVAGGYGYLRYTQTAPASSEVKSPVEAKSSEQVHSSAPAPKCFGLQLLYTFEKYRTNFEKKKAYFESFGFECHEKLGKKVGDSRQLFLVCNTVKNRSDLAPFIEMARGNHLDYQIVRDECRYAKKYVVIPAPKAKAKVQKNEALRVQETKEEPLLGDNSQKVVESKEIDPKEIERLFERTPRFALAMRLARYYYARSRYEDALKWAKKANRLDRNDEQAWIYYAKSLYKLGKKEEAKRILRIFLEYKESDAAKKLLKMWR